MLSLSSPENACRQRGSALALIAETRSIVEKPPEACIARDALPAPHNPTLGAPPEMPVSKRLYGRPSGHLSTQLPASPFLINGSLKNSFFRQRARWCSHQVTAA